MHQSLTSSLHRPPCRVFSNGPARLPVSDAQAGPERPERREIVTLPISLLSSGESPRSNGQDSTHIARLAEVDAPLPPILVARKTMQVIDGTHRLAAALAKGSTVIDVEFFDGTDEDAFLRAVEANVKHGLPLSHGDRRAAAARIIRSHPHMSDRAIAGVAGLGAKTVAAIRRSFSDTLPQLSTRVGKDGRVRPVNSAEGRIRAAEILIDRPHASLREVARRAGVSPATVSDVRRRLERGELAAPPRAEDASTSAPTARANPVPVLEKLLRDPSLRHTETGRQLLRLLRDSAVGAEKRSTLISAVPPRSAALVAQLAHQNARTWSELAQEMEDLARSTTDLAG